jgi:hypothetical protein
MRRVLMIVMLFIVGVSFIGCDKGNPTSPGAVSTKKM